MKLRKKRKKDKKNTYNIRKSILILTMLVCVIIAMITYWIYAYNHKYGGLQLDDIKLVSHKISDYLDIKGDIVYLKNINEDIIKEFTNSQQHIVTNSDIVSVDVTKGLYKNILSVMIKYTIKNNSNNYEEVLTLNIDLKTDKLLNNDDLLEMSGTNYKQIATDIFNENIKLPSDSNKIVKDAITDESYTSTEFNNNSEKYIIRIREKLPEIMKVYIDNGKIYAEVRLSEIDKVCYYTNSNNRLVNIKKELGKI